MSLRSLEFAVREAFVSIWRNGLMSIASVTTISLSLAVLGGFALLVLWLNGVAKSLSEELEICVFMKFRATPQEIAQVHDYLSQMQHVKAFTHIPAAQVWEQAKQSYKGYIDLTGIPNVSLGDEFIIKLDNAKHTSSVANEIARLKGVDEVLAPRKEAKEIVRFSNFVEILGASASGVLLIITAFIISNAIRLTVFARRREIRIMQLVGATNWFIRLPFLLEGIILGAIGGAIACGIVLGGAFYVTKVVTRMWPLLERYPGNIEPSQLLGGMVGLGCCIGLVGSFMSIRKFLKT